MESLDLVGKYLVVWEVGGEICHSLCHYEHQREELNYEPDTNYCEVDESHCLYTRLAQHHFTGPEFELVWNADSNCDDVVDLVGACDRVLAVQELKQDEILETRQYYRGKHTLVESVERWENILKHAKRLP